MRKLLVIFAAVVVLIAGACGGDDDNEAKGPSGPQTYAVDVDANAPLEHQISAYFPGKLTVRPGDTIEFTNKSKGYPHTVTLGVKADGSNRPPIITDKGVNAAAFGPCFTDTEPSAQLTACPTPPNPANPPAFAGKGYWNSGVIQNGSTQPGASNKTTVKLADNIPAGDYSFVCMLHPFMIGTLTVAPSDDVRLTPTAVRANADTASAKAISDAAALKPPAATAGAVAAGWGDRITAVNKFDPTSINVKVGDEVTWTSVSPYEPHTITFNGKFSGPEDPAATAPAGVKSGGTFTGGLAHSGFIGAPPIVPSNKFSLKFGKAGTYNYVCLLHPTMTGTVTVT